jgi:hypothetical protein
MDHKEPKTTNKRESALYLEAQFFQDTSKFLIKFLLKTIRIRAKYKNKFIKDVLIGIKNTNAISKALINAESYVRLKSMLSY